MITRKNNQQSLGFNTPTVRVLWGSSGIRHVPVADLLALKSDANYTWLHWPCGQRLLTARTLKHFEAQIPPGQFIRLRRDYTVNVAYIEGVEQSGYNRMVVQLRGGERIEVARRRIVQVRQQLGLPPA